MLYITLSTLAYLILWLDNLISSHYIIYLIIEYFIAQKKITGRNDKIINNPEIILIN